MVRSPEKAGALSARFPRLHTFVGDLRDGDVGPRWVRAALTELHTIDCLINNAAIQGPGGRLHELDWKAVEETLQVNLHAPVHLMHALLPHFVERGRGTVINLSGGGATQPRPRFAPYGAAKAALVRWTETLAGEYPEFRFFAVAPGTLKTQMTEAILALGRETAGPEFNVLSEKLAQGGDGTERATALILWLAEQAPATLNGKLISAIWDNYKAEAETSHPALWTLRRVDETLRRSLENLSHEKK